MAARCFALLLVALFGTGCSAALAQPPDARGMEFFEAKIRPVLVEHCYQCHAAGAKTLQGGLLLDSGAGLRQGGDSGPAVMPGKPEESLLLEALRYEGLEMPPKGKLPDAVIADFEAWIRLGAPDPRDGQAAQPKPSVDLEEARQFWAFRPLQKPPVPQPAAQPPATENGAAEGTEPHSDSWAQSDIDAFILAALEAKRLQPVGDADRRTLIRRVYFDLIGLPPSPEEVEAFVHDPSPEAFARVVDRLLESPHFGEHWGRHWMDVVRFAESSGGGRELILENAWRYRDYIIESFNRDKPYDRFLTEQIAGDLLPFDSPEQRAEQLVATSFLVLGPTNYELQDKVLLRMDVVDEQIDTMGRAFLGMTIGCARCHDHKFDPIPTRDYYALAGIFRSTKTLTPGNVSGFVQRQLPTTPEHEAAWKTHTAAVKELETKLAAGKAEVKKLEAEQTASRLVDRLPGIVVDDSQAEVAGQWKHSTFDPNYIGTGYLHDENSGKGEKSVTFRPELASASRYEVRLSYTASGNRAGNVPVTVQHADGEETLVIDQRQPPPLEGRFVSLGQYQFEPGKAGAVVISNRETTGHVIADAVQFIPESADPPAADKAPQVAAARPESGEPEKTPSEDHAAKLAAAGQRVKQLEAELAALKKNAPPPLPMCMSVEEEVDGERGDCRVHIRGSVRNLGEEVPRGFLSVVGPSAPPAIAPQHSGRRELAAWLTSPDNPLVARVAVNRIWHWLFGAGLVRTVDNFGTMGEEPSHPELLDYLAVRFIDQGWSFKKLIRQIVLSRTYQLSSQFDPRAAAVDPENRLLWRANRRRLEGESLRDAMLVASGQLDRTAGGPTIRPGTTSEIGYRFDSNRRSVYLPVFRNQLYDLFEVFDAADPNLVTGRRNTSTLPTQALYLMNSPAVIELSRQAAAALLAVPELDDAGRVDLAYQRTLGRPPTSEEQKLALEYLSSFGRAEESGSVDGATAPDEARLEAWSRFYHALFACIDFRYLH